jgi:radical SAM protein with 4Fe4S-binding SPASM domain
MNSLKMSFPPPLYIQFYPTTRCNQKCSFCFNGSINKNKEMPFEKALRLPDIVSENNISEIDIMGGEPLLVTWIHDFIEIALNRKISVNISTNGSLPHLTQKLSDLNPDNFRIGISLEGSDKDKHNAVTYSSNFNNAVSSIKHLVKSGLNPVVKTVIRKSSLDDIQNIINLLKDLGVKQYYLLHMDILSHNESFINEALSFIDFMDFFKKTKQANHEISIHKVNASCFEKKSLPENSRCAGGVKKLSVFPDGSVFPCNLFFGMEEFNLGNIFKDRFVDIWMNPKLDFFRKQGKNNCDIKDCSNKDSCTGGCPAHGYFHYGDMDRPDIRCRTKLAKNTLFEAAL